MGKTQLGGRELANNQVKHVDVGFESTTEKVSCADTDRFLIWDQITNCLKHITFATLRTYFTEVFVTMFTNPVFAGAATSPIFESPSFKIRNSAGVVKWTISVNASDELEFKNASGVVEATMTQSGNFTIVGILSAYDIALHN